MIERLGKYQIRARLGHGPKGEVFAAHDPQLDRPVALRVLPEKARGVAKVVHPNVVTLFESGQAEGQAFLVMELVEGMTLRAWQATPRSRDELVAMYLAVGEGLAAAHEAGVVHGDFEPENVLVGTDGRPRIADLGLVAASPDDDRAAFLRSLGEALGGLPRALRRATSMRTLIDRLGRKSSRAPFWVAGALALLAGVTWFAWPRETTAPPKPAPEAPSDEVRKLEQLEIQATARVEAGDLRGAAGLLDELLALAPRVKDDRRTALAWLRVLRLQNVGLMRPDRALLLVPAAETAVTRAGGTAELRVQLLVETAAVLVESNRAPEALARLGEARVLLAASGSAPLADVHLQNGRARMRNRQPEVALAELQAAQELVAADDPRRVDIHIERSEALRHLGRPEEALAEARAALALRERHQPATPALVDTLSILGGALHELDRDVEALELNQRALALGRIILPPDSVRLALVIGRYANVLAALDRVDEAIAFLEEAVLVHERSGTPTRPMAITIMNLGHGLAERSRCPEALPRYRRAAQIFDEVMGPGSVWMIHIAKGVGECSLETGRGVEAIPILEAALAIQSPGYFQAVQDYDRFVLGKILVESGRDRARGLALVDEARAKLATAEPAWVGGALQMLDTWRRKQR